jgi:ubiquinone/menaquinone biosynthesis C-methylase UbiE
MPPGTASTLPLPMADNPFADPRVAALYDPLDPDRRDLDIYAAIVDEFDAASVVDIGCGTGIFACLLAQRGKHVVGVDPSPAMIEIARAKPGAHHVRWIVGDPTVLPALPYDMATMTGNVAQVFLTDEEWSTTLRATRKAVRPGGTLVFETRDPAKEAWRGWNRDQTFTRATIPGVGTIETWEDLLDATPPLVTFRSTICFEATGETVVAQSTLRFRAKEELTTSLHDAGFTVVENRDAPDRPGCEFIFVARTAPDRADAPG